LDFVVEILIPQTAWSGCVPQFPLTMYAVVGTQADRADRNKISLLKLSDLHRTHADGKAALARCRNASGYQRNGEITLCLHVLFADSDEDDDGEDEPTLDHVSVPHRGGVNRIRVRQ
jgi:ribosome assembly protein RRB1